MRQLCCCCRGTTGIPGRPRRLLLLRIGGGAVLLLAAVRLRHRLASCWLLAACLRRCRRLLRSLGSGSTRAKLLRSCTPGSQRYLLLEQQGGSGRQRRAALRPQQQLLRCGRVCRCCTPHGSLLQGLLQGLEQRRRQHGLLRLRGLLVLLHHVGLQLHGGCRAARLCLRQRRQRRVLLQQPLQLVRAALLHERGGQLPASCPLLCLQQYRRNFSGACTCRLLIQLRLEQGSCCRRSHRRHGWPCLWRRCSGQRREPKHGIHGCHALLLLLLLRYGSRCQGCSLCIAEQLSDLTLAPLHPLQSGCCKLLLGRLLGWLRLTCQLARQPEQRQRRLGGCRRCRAGGGGSAELHGWAGPTGAAHSAFALACKRHHRQARIREVEHASGKGKSGSLATQAWTARTQHGLASPPLTLSLAAASPRRARWLRYRKRQRRRLRLRSEQVEGAARRPLRQHHRRHCRHRRWHWRQRQRKQGRGGGAGGQGRRRRRVAGGEQPLGSFHHAHELLHAPRVLQQLLWVLQQLAQLGSLLRAASKLKEQASCSGDKW